MTEHDRLRDLLALAASGDISAADLRRLQAHLAECETCRTRSDDFASLAGALRGLPTPQPSPELLARVRALAEARLSSVRGWPADAKLLGPLVACSWTVAIMTWPLFGYAGAWISNWWRLPGDEIYSVLAVYSILGVGLASAAAIGVAKHARMNGRLR